MTLDIPQYIIDDLVANPHDESRHLQVCRWILEHINEITKNVDIEE